MRDLSAMRAVNRHVEMRHQRRKLRQKLREITPLINLRRGGPSLTTTSPIEQTVNREIANRKEIHRHG